jgi:hypothetical protein
MARSREDLQLRLVFLQDQGKGQCLDAGSSLSTRPQVYIHYMSPHNYANCIGNYCVAVLSGEIATACWLSSG